MAIPTAYTQNEFYTEIMNLIITQYVNDSIKFIDPLAKAFYRADVTSGDQMALYTADVLTENQYDDTSKTLLTVFSPKEDTQVIPTTDKIFFGLTNNRFIARGAFSSPTNLAEFINYVISMLGKSKQIYTYKKIIEDINAMDSRTLPQGVEWKDTQTVTINLEDTDSLTGANKAQAEKRNSKKIYETLMNYSKYLQRPSTKFNELGYTQTTDVADLLCIVNSEVDTSISVDVFASLLNSNKIAENQVWAEKIFIPTDSLDSPNTIGYLMDKNAYAIANRILTATAFFNARSLNDSNFLHLWLLRGVVNGLQKVKFVANYTTAQSE